jgi:hypothetical protein
MFPLIIILPARNSTRFLLWLGDEELLKRLIFSLSCLTLFNATKATQVTATIYQKHWQMYRLQNEKTRTSKAKIPDYKMKKLGPAKQKYQITFYKDFKSQVFKMTSDKL